MSRRGRRALPKENKGDMFEVFSKWRRFLGINKRPGVVAKFKRRFHKLTRRVAKQEIREQS